MNHEETKMQRGSQTAKKVKYATGRQGNVWTSSYFCPICGVRVKRLSNPMSGFALFCAGDKQVKRKYPA